MSDKPSYEALEEQIEQLREALARQMRLPVPRADGIDMALEGLSLEITRMVNGKHRLTTFETVGKVAGIAHQIYLLRLLMRDLSLDDLTDAEDMFPEDLDANLGGRRYGNMANPYAAYDPVNRGEMRRVAARVRRARIRRRAGRRGHGGLDDLIDEANVRVDDVLRRDQRRGNPDPYHHAQGYGRQDDDDEPNFGLGAPYNAWAGDVRDEPGNPVAGWAGMMNGIVEVLDRQTGQDRERKRVEGMFLKVRNLGQVIRDLKAERNELQREHGDDHPELPKLNADITRFKAQRAELLERVAALSAEQHVDDLSEPEDDLRPPPKRTAPVANHACTKCDQVQGPFWIDEDGDPMPCDICGAPMKRVEDADDVGHHEPNGPCRPQPPHETKRDPNQ